MNGLAGKIRNQLDGASQLYHRLILVVGPAGSGKTAALQELSESLGVPYVNLNLALSQRLLDYTSKARPLRVPQLLDEIVNGMGSAVVLLDNIEVLFDQTLKQDPLRTLERLSRNRTIVATWNGRAHGKTLTYAAPGHPEYKCYSDIPPLVIDARATQAACAEGDQK